LNMASKYDYLTDKQLFYVVEMIESNYNMAMDHGDDGLAGAFMDQLNGLWDEIFKRLDSFEAGDALVA